MAGLTTALSIPWPFQTLKAVSQRPQRHYEYTYAPAHVPQVTLSGGKELLARVVGVDQDRDIAVLQVKNMDGVADGAVTKPLARCSSSADLVVGQKVRCTATQYIFYANFIASRWSQRFYSSSMVSIIKSGCSLRRYLPSAILSGSITR